MSGNQSFTIIQASKTIRFRTEKLTILNIVMRQIYTSTRVLVILQLTLPTILIKKEVEENQLPTLQQDVEENQIDSSVKEMKVEELEFKTEQVDEDMFPMNLNDQNPEENPSTPLRVRFI